MTLLPSCEKIESLGGSNENLNAILKLDKNAAREQVVTEVALVCLQEIENVKPGFTFTIKKFMATWLSYAGLLSAPIASILGLTWRYSDSLGTNAIPLGMTAASLVAADYAIGKTLGIRPITAALMIGYDAYRQGAQTASRYVEESYTTAEKEAEKIVDARKTTLKQKLKHTYECMAGELAKQMGTATSTNVAGLKQNVITLQKKLPIVSNLLKGMGLSKADVMEILDPLKTAATIIERQLTTPTRKAS